MIWSAALAILLLQEPTADDIAKRLAEPLAEVDNLSFDFRATLGGGYYGGRVDGRVRLVRGSFLELEFIRTQTWGSRVFVSEAFDAERYALRKSSSNFGTAVSFQATRASYPLPINQTYGEGSYAQNSLLLPMLFPEAYVRSLPHLKIHPPKDDQAALTSWSAPSGIRTETHALIDLKQGRVTQVRTRGGLAGEELRVDEWTHVGGVPMPRRILHRFSSWSYETDMTIHITYSNVRLNADAAPSKPDWMEDPLLPGNTPAREADLKAQMSDAADSAEPYFRYALAFSNHPDAARASARAVALAPESVAALELYLRTHPGDDGTESVLAAALKRNVTSPLIAWRCAMDRSDAGDAEGAWAWIESVTSTGSFGATLGPLRVRIQADRLDPPHFVKWFKENFSDRSLEAVKYLAAAHKPTMPGMPASRGPDEPDQAFFDAIASLDLPAPLKVALARHRLEEDPKESATLYLEVAGNPDLVSLLSEEIATAAEKLEEEEVGPLTTAAAEAGTANLKLLNRYVQDRIAEGESSSALKAIDASVKRFDDPEAFSSIMASVFSGSGEFVGNLKDLLSELIDLEAMDTAKRLLEAAQTSWFGNAQSVTSEAREIFGEGTIELYRYASQSMPGYYTSDGGLSLYGLSSSDIVELLEGEFETKSLRREDLVPTRRWLRNEEAKRWIGLIEKAVQRFGEDPALIELLGDARFANGEHADAMKQYGRAMEMRTRSNPFDEPMSGPVFDQSAMFFMQPQMASAPKYSKADPAVVKLAFAARDSGSTDRAIQILDRARRDHPDDHPLMDFAKAYEILDATDRAIEVYKRELADPTGSFIVNIYAQQPPSAGGTLCRLMKSKKQWETLYLAAELWRRIPPQATNPYVIVYPNQGQKTAEQEAQEYQEEARKHLASDHFARKFLAEAPALKDPKKRKQAERLIRRLGSDDAEARDQASRELTGMGAEITGVLKPLLDSKDPEVRSRAVAIISGWAVPHFLRKFRGEEK